MVRIGFLIGAAALLLAGLLASCAPERPTGADNRGAVVQIEPLSALDAWPPGRQRIAVVFERPLTFEQYGDVFSQLDGGAFSLFYQLGSLQGAVRSPEPMPADWHVERAKAMLESFLTDRPDRERRAIERAIWRYGLDGYDRDAALKIFLASERLQNLARSLVGRDRLRSWIPEALRGERSLVYAAEVYATPKSLRRALSSRVAAGVQRLDRAGVHLPKPSQVRSSYRTFMEELKLLDGEVLFDSAVRILRDVYGVELFGGGAQ